MRSWKRKGKEGEFWPDIERAASAVLHHAYWLNIYHQLSEKAVMAVISSGRNKLREAGF